MKAKATAEPELTLESPEDEAKRLKGLEQKEVPAETPAPVTEIPASVQQEELKHAAQVSEAQAAEEAVKVLARIQAMPDTLADQPQVGTEGIVRQSLGHESLVGESAVQQEQAVAEKIPNTWDELGVNKGRLEKILLTDELTASDSPDAANISEAERSQNRIVRAKAEEGLFEKLGKSTLSTEEKALLLQYVAKKTAWAHPSGFIPEAARKDEEVMKAVAQGSPAGARFAKDLGFNFSSKDESAIEKELDPTAQKIKQAKTLGELVTILNGSKSYESPEAGHIEVNLDVQTMVYEINQKNTEIQRLLAAGDAKENPKIQQSLRELNDKTTKTVVTLEPYLQEKVRQLLASK